MEQALIKINIVSINPLAHLSGWIYFIYKDCRPIPFWLQFPKFRQIFQKIFPLIFHVKLKICLQNLSGILIILLQNRI